MRHWGTVSLSLWKVEVQYTTVHDWLRSVSLGLMPHFSPFFSFFRLFFFFLLNDGYGLRNHRKNTKPQGALNKLLYNSSFTLLSSGYTVSWRHGMGIEHYHGLVPLLVKTSIVEEVRAGIKMSHCAVLTRPPSGQWHSTTSAKLNQGRL